MLHSPAPPTVGNHCTRLDHATSPTTASCSYAASLSLAADLDDVGGLLRVLLEQQHGGGVGVDVELAQQGGVVGLALVHVPEAHVVPEGEGCQLQMAVQ